MRVMKQIDTWDHLAIPCQYKAGENTLESSSSSPESSCLMTPDISDTEDEELLPLHGRSSSHGEVEDLVETTAAAPEELEDETKNLNHPLDFSNSDSDDGYNDWAALSDAGDENSDNVYEVFYDPPTMPQPYYGSLLSSVRNSDKATLEDISSREINGLSRAMTRVLRDLNNIHQDETVPYLSVAPVGGSFGNCLASMEGSPGTPWEDRIFWLSIEYPNDYPVEAPVMTFLTPVYHPNIDSNGRIGIDILEDAWSPCMTTKSMLLSILSVLHSPILEDALVPEIANKYSTDYWDFHHIARIYMEEMGTVLRPDTSDLIKLAIRERA